MQTLTGGWTAANSRLSSGQQCTLPTRRAASAMTRGSTVWADACRSRRAPPPTMANAVLMIRSRSWLHVKLPARGGRCTRSRPVLERALLLCLVFYESALLRHVQPDQRNEPGPLLLWNLQQIRGNALQGLHVIVGDFVRHFALLDVPRQELQRVDDGSDYRVVVVRHDWTLRGRTRRFRRTSAAVVPLRHAARVAVVGATRKDRSAFVLGSRRLVRNHLGVALLRDDPGATGPAVTAERISQVDSELGLRLPDAYLAVLRERNGGELVKDCFRTAFRSSWGGDYFQVGLLLGIGPAELSVLDSKYMIEEWQIPVNGLLISSTPSGHDWVLLDYGDCGPQGEPAVVYVDEGSPGDPVVHRVADTFAGFLAALVLAPEPDG